MSWVEKIEQNLTIACGEGSVFTPKFINSSKAKEYNSTAFTFIDVPGQLVDRKQPSARTYQLTIYFDGENNLEQSAAFEKAADDPRPWTLSHPYYGNLNVQPLSIAFNNSAHNVSEITIELIESLTEEFPSADVDVTDQIAQDVAKANESLAMLFDDADAQSIQSLGANNSSAYNSGKIQAPEENQNEYFNTFRAATAAINNASSEPLNAMRMAQRVLNAPAKFGQSAKNRVAILKFQFESLQATINVAMTLAQKLLMQASLGTTLTATAEATNGEYESRGEAVEVIDDIQELNDEYLKALDAMRGNGFLPNSQAVNQSISAASFAAANVLSILNDTRQERVHTLEADSNLIVLAHRFNQMNDLDAFIRLNDIGINEHLQIDQGRVIKYFV